MFNSKMTHTADSVAEKISQSASDAMHSVQHLADETLDDVAHAAGSVRESTQALTHRASQYVKSDPLKSVLVAALSGAVVMAAVSFLARARR